MSDINSYLFIDGNYFRRAYEDSMRQFFGNDVTQEDIDFVGIRQSLGASKAFYYDVVDEDAADAEVRRNFLDRICQLDGFHVREGSLSRDKKKQKQIDVALAVECLTHAFHKNVWHVSLLAGDLDFKPLVDALINLGIHVHVVFEPKSGARRLHRAADVAYPVTVEQFYQWSTNEFRMAHPAPQDTTVVGNFDHPAGIHTLDKQGDWRGQPTRLYTALDTTSVLWLMPYKQRKPLILRFQDKERLLKYFELTRGKINWTK